jgi:hypothetical protein
MPTTPATADPTARSIDEQFLELICADADLLAAEFDAIVAAEWPEPPPADRPGSGAAGRQPGRGAARRAADPVRGPVPRPRPADIGGWARQRSPPRSDTRPTTGRKAGDRHT